jgi:hypothetical protein
VKTQAHRRAAQLGLGAAIVLFLGSVAILMPTGAKPTPPVLKQEAIQLPAQQPLTIATQTPDSGSLAAQLR